MRGAQETPDDSERIEAALVELGEIANLPDFLDYGFAFLAERRRDYGAFWEKAKEVSALFKPSRLHHDIRERLWRRHDSLCERVKDFQRREREHKHNESTRNRDEILSILREARSWLNGASTFGHLSECRRRLGDAMGRMKEKFLLKDHGDECWNLWRELNNRFPFRREEICDANYALFDGEAHRIVNLATYGDPHEAFKAIQNLQRELNAGEITRSQKQRLREILDKYWSVAIVFGVD